MYQFHLPGHLLGAFIKMTGTYSLCPEVASWCRENLKGTYRTDITLLETHALSRSDLQPVIILRNEDDAFHFKMRWL
jgi:hypothetical protein